MRRALIALALLPLLGPGVASAQPPATPCCGIIAIDAATGVVSAKVTADGKLFQFKVTNRRILTSLRVGQRVFANFSARQVSLDGRAACCTITSGPTAAAPTAPVRAPVLAAPPPPPPPAPARAAVPAAAAVALASVQAPILSFGTPEPVTAANRLTRLNASLVSRGTRYELRELRATIGNRMVTKRVLHLAGLEGIENAPEILPDGVRRLLEIHARKTPKGQQTHYIVDPDVTREWIESHTVDPDIKVKSGKKCKGSEWERLRCRTQKSWDNLEDMTDAEWDRLRERAQGWWDEAAEKLKQCTTGTDGWKDQTMTGPTFPVRFSKTPNLPLSWTGSSDKGGSVTVRVDLGLPLQGDFRVGTQLFYIPCLPGVYRFRSIATEGSMTVGQRLGVNVQAADEFQKNLPVGPANGIQYPLYVIPVVINGFPVAEFDVSAHLEGDVLVNARAEVDASMVLTNSNQVDFDINCDGRGCRPGGGKNKVPRTSGSTSATESAQIRGQVTVTPKLYTALEVNFNINVLTARAGPETRLIGQGAACIGAAATQTSGGGSTSAQGAALVADLDWGIKLIAEALALDERIGEPYTTDIKPREHLWWKDLAPGGSTALVAAVSGPTQATAGQPAEYSVRLPCYHSDGPVRYRVIWTGGATPATVSAAAPTGRRGSVSSPPCTWLQGSGTCTFDPTSEMKFSLRWASTGPQSVSVVLTGDDHVQTFSPALPVRKLDVTVAGGGGGTP